MSQLHLPTYLGISLYLSLSLLTLPIQPTSVPPYLPSKLLASISILGQNILKQHNTIFQ